MNQWKLAPALGWPAGIALAVVMLALACAVVVVHVRRRADGSSDETAWACARRCAICVIVAVMALTPSTVERTTNRAVNATDVVVATDVTGSMAVKDATYGSKDTMTRLDAAKRAIDDLTKSYPNSNFAAARFGASSTVDVPLTPDVGAIRGWADALQPEPTSLSAGSSLDAPIDPLLVELKSVRNSHPQDRIVLYVITDGEQTSTKVRRSYSPLRHYLDDAFTLGVGSKAGGNIPEIAAGDADSPGSVKQGDWVKDPDTGQPGVSKLDAKNLAGIADEMSGKSVLLDDSHTVTGRDMTPLSNRWRITQTPKKHERVTAVIWPEAMALVALLACELGAWISTSRRLL
ncbi:VWA domain-containing protein [Bifidobacterium sp. ESL0763]|uniref:vWA domain-containing protein n=1 Tax=Bifidobacterium sp. ESL0763 TaxID=2983227 RepID=UPI0023F960E7|nr:VWA domain-containing protein [Bifidobacterium sp. ESL0763]MDF7663659.1 VWA domain-containing protein [Bifidobacterium sp. ESL0763]